jgi:hypothetical protein
MLRKDARMMLRQTFAIAIALAACAPARRRPARLGGGDQPAPVGRVGCRGRARPRLRLAVRADPRGPGADVPVGAAERRRGRSWWWRPGTPRRCARWRRALWDGGKDGSLFVSASATGRDRSYVVVRGDLRGEDREGHEPLPAGLLVVHGAGARRDLAEPAAVARTRTVGGAEQHARARVGDPGGPGAAAEPERSCARGRGWR